VQQIRHTAESGFSFVVMRRAFVVHPGIKWAYTGYHPKKDYETNLNRILYQAFEKELDVMYKSPEAIAKRQYVQEISRYYGYRSSLFFCRYSSPIDSLTRNEEAKLMTG
jgi:hypothetical protein